MILIRCNKHCNGIIGYKKCITEKWRPGCGCARVCACMCLHVHVYVFVCLFVCACMHAYSCMRACYPVSACSVLGGERIIKDKNEEKLILHQLLFHSKSPLKQLVCADNVCSFPFIILLLFYYFSILCELFAIY